MWLLFLQAFWFIAPAYAANAFPPLVKGKRPLDFSRKLRHNRILGNGKTLEGTTTGIVFGMFIGSIQILGQGSIPPELGLTEMTLPLIFLLSAGALFGDIIGAFIKRRFGIPRGSPAPLLDQLDFLAFALIFSSFIIAINMYHIIILIFLTPIIHWIANLIGYYTKVKKTPW